MASPDPWSLSQDGDFLRYKGLLYVPDNQEVRLDILHSHHDHHLVGHPGITKIIKNICCQFYWPQIGFHTGMGWVRQVNTAPTCKWFGKNPQCFISKITRMLC